MNPDNYGNAQKPANASTLRGLCWSLNIVGFQM